MLTALPRVKWHLLSCKYLYSDLHIQKHCVPRGILAEPEECVSVRWVSFLMMQLQVWTSPDELNSPISSFKKCPWLSFNIFLSWIKLTLRFNFRHKDNRKDETVICGYTIISDPPFFRPLKTPAFLFICGWQFVHVNSWGGILFSDNIIPPMSQPGYLRYWCSYPGETNMLHSFQAKTFPHPYHLVHIVT